MQFRYNRGSGLKVRFIVVLKNVHFLIKNPDFLLKNVDFIIKQQHLNAVHAKDRDLSGVSDSEKGAVATWLEAMAAEADGLGVQLRRRCVSIYR